MDKKSKGTGTATLSDFALDELAAVSIPDIDPKVASLAEATPSTTSGAPQAMPTISPELTREQLNWSAAPEAMKAMLERERFMKDLEQANLAARANVAASTNAPIITAPAPGASPLGGGRKLQRK